MAERPKTAAEIAEQNGELDLTDSYSIVHLRTNIENLRGVIHEMQQRLGWIAGSVRAAFSGNITNVDEQTLNELLNKLTDLETKALKIGDILVGDCDEN